LHSFDQYEVFFVGVVIIEHAAIFHYRVVLLRDLVALREVRVVVVLTVELNIVRNSARQSKTAADRFVEAVFVQHR